MAREVKIEERKAAGYFNRGFPMSRILTRKDNQILMEGMQESDSAIEFLHNFINKRCEISNKNDEVEKK